MKLVKGYALISQKELDEALRDAEKRGVEKGGKESKTRIENLEKGIERKDKALEIMERDYNDAKIKIEVLEEERDDVREVVKQKMDNDDLAAVLSAKKESLDKQTAALKDRESKIGSKEEGEYKKGYADGVADGVRKINEITQEDRNNAMKVAMVAAASHSTPEVVREITSGSAQLASGLEDKED